MTQASKLAQIGSPGVSTGFKNRIINGNMAIDQRNAGASVTVTTSTGYTLDRWQIAVSQSSKLTCQQNAGSVTPPNGFSSYLGITSSSAYSVNSGDYFLINHFIEGLNTADLNWGTANAATVTLSFWVRSSLTGTFSGCLDNDGNSRSYPFTYTISSANTWEQKSITIAGDTSGTWLKTNSKGIGVRFSLGVGSTYTTTAGAWASGTYFNATGATSVVGTNGATFYITGVQFEVGTTATDFEYVDYGRQLAQCQRYYQMSYPSGTVPGTASSGGYMWFGVVMPANTSFTLGTISFKTTMRTTPSISIWGESTASNTIAFPGYGEYAISAVSRISDGGFSQLQNSAGRPSGYTGLANWTASAEL